MTDPVDDLPGCKLIYFDEMRKHVALQLIARDVVGHLPASVKAEFASENGY